MATLTTVVSRIDITAPSTTTPATASSARSSAPSGPVAEDIGGRLPLGMDVQDGEEHVVHELLGERVVDRLAGDDHARQDDGAGDVCEQRRHCSGGQLGTGPGALEDRREAR